METLLASTNLHPLITSTKGQVNLNFTLPDDDDDDESVKDVPTISVYIKALEELTKGFIERFFKDKTFHCGGPIPRNSLYSEQSINLVLGTEFCVGIDQCYEAISTLRKPRNYNDETIEWDIGIVLSLINEARSMEIPKDFQAGIMLLYLKLCKGCRTPEKKELDITHLIYCE